jgi:hypothetical protein
MLKPGSDTGTLKSTVPHSAVPRPIRTRFTEKVESRLISGGRPIMRCTAIQYSATPTIRPPMRTGGKVA